jgi:hypothetical protein
MLPDEAQRISLIANTRVLLKNWKQILVLFIFLQINRLNGPKRGQIDQWEDLWLAKSTLFFLIMTGC